MRKIYAFVKSWSPEGERMELVRERLRATGTEMQVLSAKGVWTVGGDAISFTDQIAGDHVTESLLCRVRDGRDAVFVLDDQGALTFSQSWETS
jgi:cyanophycinase-like exopeptidase